MEMNVNQALEIVARACDLALLNGNDHRAKNQAIAVLAESIKPAPQPEKKDGDK